MTASRKTEYLVVGNSVGAIGAIEAIRGVDRAGSITIVSDEPYPVYSRPLISDYLAHPGPIERMLYRRPDFYESNRVHAVLGEKAVRLDKRERTVTLAGGQKLAWRKLLLATGGAPIVPPTPGADLRGVFTFNKLDDAKAIDVFLSGRRDNVRAVVIGGGLIGVSVTEALVKRGVGVTIVEMKDRVLNTILDAEASAMEAAALAESGVNVVTDHTVTKISARLPGEVGGATLDDGRTFAGEMVVIAIGVRPRLALAKEGGIRTNRGIVVDRRMTTSVPDVYACGDAAEAFDFVLGENRPTPVWPNAYEGGRVAGLNMAGVPTEYPGGTAINALKYFGINIVSAGLSVPPDNTYEVLSQRNNGVYRKVIIKDNKVVGLVFAGDIDKSGIVYNLMKDGTDVADIKKTIVADSFGLASLPESLRRERLPAPAEGVAAVAGPAEAPEEALIGD
jgi:NAD(P)H-nitrite reductase large subunit